MEAGKEQNFLQPEEKEFQAFYKREVWWLEHRAKLKKIGLGIFLFIDLVAFLFAGWKFLDAYAISFDAEKRSLVALVVSGQAELRAFSQKTAPAPLALGAAGAVPSGDELNYDLYGTLTNPNSDWSATFHYAFKLKGGQTAEQSGFILPGEEKVLVAFKTTTARSAEVDLLLSEVEWRRLDPHVISDYESWAAEHRLTISEAAFSRQDNAAVVSFVVKNQTAYSFWQPSFLVVLWRGGTVGGLIRLSTTEIASGQTKTLSARWFGAAPAVSKINVYPEINLLDPDAYSSLEGESSLDSRTKAPSR
jgi:hypothetical protein